MRTTTQWAMLGLSVALLPAVGLGMPDQAGEDYSKSHIGSLGLGHGLQDAWEQVCEAVAGNDECPTNLPEDLGIVIGCDDSLPHVGAVRLCIIPFPARVRIDIEDEIVQSVRAKVFCTLPGGWLYLFTFEGSGIGYLPTTCLPDASIPPDRTDVYVVLQAPPSGSGATQGSVRLVLMS